MTSIDLEQDEEESRTKKTRWERVFTAHLANQVVLSSGEAGTVSALCKSQS